MKNITHICRYCRQEFEVTPYFSDARIYTDEDPFRLTREYVAEAKGKMVCPYCGQLIQHTFKASVTNEDIITLALGRYLE